MCGVRGHNTVLARLHVACELRVCGVGDACTCSCIGVTAPTILAPTVPFGMPEPCSVPCLNRTDHQYMTYARVPHTARLAGMQVMMM